MIKLIGVDFDGTLASMDIYRDSELRFFDTVKKHGATPEQQQLIQDKLLETEKENLRITGFGVPLNLMSFLDLTTKYAPQIVDASLVKDIMENIKALRDAAPRIYDDSRDFMDRARAIMTSSLGLAPDDHTRVLIVTKGQEHRQHDKIRVLESVFNDASFLDGAHVIADKTEKHYLRVLRTEGVKPEEFVMVGDSALSDVNPVLAIGGHAVLVTRPDEQGLTWAFENAQAAGNVICVKDLREAADAIETLVRTHNNPGLLNQPRPGAGPRH